jgi:hypothetical protein
MGESLKMKIRKRIKLFRVFIFLTTLTISLFIFNIYAAFKFDEKSFLRSAHLTKLQSDNLKDLIGLSDFSSLTIKGYNHKIVDGNVNREFTFDLTIPADDFKNFLEFINNNSNPQNDSSIYIKEDSLILHSSLYKLQIEYSTSNGSYILGYILNTDYIRYSKNTWVIVLQFILLLFSNSLIILPYKRIIAFLHNNKKMSPKN